MLRAPIWMTSAAAATASMWRGSISSVTSGSPVASRASSRIASACAPSPRKLYGDVRGLNAPPRSMLAPAACTARRWPASARATPPCTARRSARNGRRRRAGRAPGSRWARGRLDRGELVRLRDRQDLLDAGAHRRATGSSSRPCSPIAPITVASRPGATRPWAPAPARRSSTSSTSSSVAPPPITITNCSSCVLVSIITGPPFSTLVAARGERPPSLRPVAHRLDAAHGAAQEHLVRRHQTLPRERLLAHRGTGGARHGEHPRARTPGRMRPSAGGVRARRAPREDVRARRLEHGPVGVEQQRDRAGAGSRSAGSRIPRSAHLCAPRPPGTTSRTKPHRRDREHHIRVDGRDPDVAGRPARGGDERHPHPAELQRARGREDLRPPVAGVGGAEQLLGARRQACEVHLELDRAAAADEHRLEHAGRRVGEIPCHRRRSPVQPVPSPSRPHRPAPSPPSPPTCAAWPGSGGCRRRCARSARPPRRRCTRATTC